MERYGGGGDGGGGGAAMMMRDLNPRLRWTADLHDRFGDAVTKLGGPNSRESPIAEALRTQIEAQKKLQEQIEVQKKLQMRIEGRGKYLQAILEKAQRSLSAGTDHPESLETTKAQLTDVNLAQSSFMETINGEDRNGNVTGSAVVKNGKAFESSYNKEAQDMKDIKLKLEGPF